MTDLEKIKNLIAKLSEAAKAYYSEGREIMTNREYDALYDELVLQEKKTGICLSSSPTQNVGYEVLSSLPKEKHEKAALSLDKTKDVGALEEFLGKEKGVLSWKLDGLTIVLTYDGGELTKAVTRGNGEVGEVITANAKTFTNLPLRIPYKEHLVLRGEALISYPDFERMNAEIDSSEKYKNPRNLCAGSVRQLDSSVTAKRHVRLIAFSLIESGPEDFKDSMNEQLNFLDSLGFETVPRVIVTRENVRETVKKYSKDIENFELPSDGLVLVLDSLSYGESLGRTSKYPRNAIAFKWQDETAETTLREIEWSASRTGLINPVAIFDPVELEGTTVKRASVHNISICEELELGIGDTVSVYKANMIIPQIGENKTKSGHFPIPEFCPVCGEKTKIRDENGVKTLFCENPECPAKKIKRFDLFVSRNAMNIEGISEATLERFIDEGWVRKFGDIYRLKEKKEEILSLDGFGEKSFENMILSIENSREVLTENFLYAIGIPNVGIATAKTISRHFKDDFEKIRRATASELQDCDDVGEIMAEETVKFFRDEKKQAEIDDVLKEIRFLKREITEEQIFFGKTFVITGSVHHFANRDELKKFIEDRGGKTSGSVSKNTDALINNDSTSESTKNKKAKELDVPILTEEEFLALTKK